MSATGERFSVRFGDQVTPYDVQGIFVLPGEELDLEALPGPAGRAFDLQAEGGTAVQLAPNRWRWRAPLAKGLYPVRILDPVARDSTLLNIFVLVEYAGLRDGTLNGYRIGTYPGRSPGEARAYGPPRGFVEVTAQNRDVRVAPHFRLGQFVCKESASGPCYLVLQERLLLQLEDIVQRLQTVGYSIPTLHVMSGYRTPFYNRAIGDVRLSQHQFGAAADIFVDRDGDDTMDDLNRDGRIDRRDAQFLFDLIEAATPGAPYPGGLAHYEATAVHGPFVHVDVRGYPARWGT